MTIWGGWHYVGGNGVRLGADWNYTAGNTLNVYISTQTQYNYSGDAWTLAWSGAYAGSAGLVLNSSSSQIQQVWSGSFTQSYNSTATITFGGSAFYNGSTPSVTFGAVLGPLPPSAPTSVGPVWISDAQIDLTWLNNTSGAAPYDNISVIRHDNVAGDSAVGWLAGSVSAFSDTGLVADRKFSYTITAVNSSGSTSSATSATIYMTPAAPTGCTATKTGGGDITVTWTNTSTYAADTPVEVWHAANGVWDGSALATVAAGAPATYTHTTPSTAVTHTYRVRAKTPSGTTRYSGYSTSNVVTLLSAPSAPTSLAQTSSVSQNADGSIVDNGAATNKITATWVHQPNDSTPQASYQLLYQVSTDNGVTWGSVVDSGQITSPTSSRLFSAVFSYGNTVRWQVKTWGAYATGSPYSAYSTFKVVARPVGTNTTPTTGTTSTLTGTGTYFSASSSAQTAARWTLRTTGGTVIETATVSSSGSFLTYTFATAVQDATSYVVAYQVQDTNGQWSAEATVTVAVSYTKPPTPSLVVTFVEAGGYVTGTITNPAGLAAAYNTVFRDGVIVKGLEAIAPNGTWVDMIPPLNGAPSYTVVATSATPSTSLVSTPAVALTTTSRVWLNGGPGWTQSVGLQAGAHVSWAPSRQRVYQQYKNRKWPLLYTGVARDLQGTLTGSADLATIRLLTDLADLDGSLCYRDPDNTKIWVGAGSPTWDSGAGAHPLRPFSLAMTRVDDAE